MERKFVNSATSKIRKRACSSSSSSSLVRKYRFKRAILVGKRGWLSTPMAATQNGRDAAKGGIETGISARKLAATLWEINDVPSPKAVTKKKGIVQSELLPPHLSDPSDSPVTERIDPPRGGGHLRRTSGISQKLQITECNLGGLDSVTNAHTIEMETNPRRKNPFGYTSGTKNRLKDVRNSLVTSKELLRVLNRVLGLEDHHSSSASLVSAMRVELDRARLQVDQMIQEERSYRSEINNHLKQLAEENTAWKRKERERNRDAISSMGAELDVEKKLRRQTERINKKLGKELMDTKTSLSNALKELRSEKRAKDVLEQVCDELAKGIGEDKAEVEELKRESAKVREEVEKEREMLQLADMLREERVQMKLSEAKFHFEEKNAAVDKLKKKLQSYMHNKLRKVKGGNSPESERIKELRIVLRNAGIDSFKKCEKAFDKDHEENEEEEEEDEEEDSGESDLHSIELNMGKNNSRKSYEWNFACGDSNQDDSRRSSVEVFKGRKSLSEKVQWGSICLNKVSSGGLQCEFIAAYHEDLDGIHEETLPNTST